MLKMVKIEPPHWVRGQNPAPCEALLLSGPALSSEVCCCNLKLLCDLSFNCGAGKSS
jgi:hypothetical protein